MKEEFNVTIERMKGMTTGDGILFIEVEDLTNGNVFKLKRGNFRSQTKATNHAKSILELAREL